MMLVSTLVTNNAIAPEACRDWAKTFEARKPKSEPKSWTTVRRVLVMRTGVTDWVLDPVPVYTQLNGVDKGALCECKWRTWRLIASTAQT